MAVRVTLSKAVLWTGKDEVSSKASKVARREVRRVLADVVAAAVGASPGTCTTRVRGRAGWRVMVARVMTRMTSGEACCPPP